MNNKPRLPLKPLVSVMLALSLSLGVGIAQSNLQFKKHQLNTTNSKNQSTWQPLTPRLRKPITGLTSKPPSAVSKQQLQQSIYEAFEPASANRQTAARAQIQTQTNATSSSPNRYLQESPAD